MKNNRPPISLSKKICIVCEGDEEFEYIKTLKSLKIFSNKYSISPLNADGIDKIVDVYDGVLKQDSHDIILIFCDTDDPPYEKYNKLKEDIANLLGKKTTPPIIFYGNPCTMQVILSHFKKVKIKKRLKSVNAPLIKELTGVANYKAKMHQIQSIMKKISSKNFKTMCDNLTNVSQKDTDTSSTNFLTLVGYLNNNSYNWIKKLESAIF